MLGKLRDKYQANCTIYKTHNVTTNHRGTECIGKDTDLNFHIGKAKGINIEPGNDNVSKSSWDITIAFEGLEADGCLTKCLPSNQAKLTALTREIHSLQK